MDAAAPPERRPRRFPVTILVVIAILILYPLALVLYHSETSERHGGFSTEAASQPNRIDLRGQIVAVDLSKGDLTIRLNARPTGDFLNQNGLALSRDVLLLVDTDAGTVERAFPKNRAMAPFEVVVSMFGGEVSDYPFDNHQALLNLYATSGDAGVATTVPVTFDFDTAWQGLLIGAEPDAESSPGHVAVDLTIGRSRTTVGVAIFIMLVQVGLAIALLFLLFSILQRRRKIELGMFAWMGGMLFAFPALRNASPGIPPVVGTLSDYMAFFWAEGLVGLILLITLATWLIRPQN